MPPKRKAVEEAEGQSTIKRVTRATSRQQPSRPAPARKSRTKQQETIPDSDDELDVIPVRESTPPPVPGPKRRGRQRKAQQEAVVEAPQRIATRTRNRRRFADDEAEEEEEEKKPRKVVAKKPTRQYGSKKRVRLAESEPEVDGESDLIPCFTEEPQTQSLSPTTIPHKGSSEVSEYRALPASLLVYKRAILSQIHNPVMTSSESVDESDGEDDDDEVTNEVAVRQIKDLLDGSVHRGEGNSCMVLGPRGSGKSRIVEQCIAELDQKPIVIRLSGWLQHNDRLAMREMAHQLNEQAATQFHVGDEGQRNVEEDENPFIDAPPHEEFDTDFSVVPAAHIHALITCIPTLSRPTVLILEGFDLFALHPRQSLLYSLLDTVQSCRAGAEYKGMVVVGITTRMDTINLFEKRVKSRFSGRMIRTSAPRRTKDWLHVARGMLLPSLDHHPCLSGHDAFRNDWEKHVDDFLSHETTRRIFDETFALTKDVRVLSRLLMSTVIKLSPSSPWPTPAHLEEATKVQRIRPPFPQLCDLSYPSLCLLVASIRAETLGYPAVTFEMLHQFVHDEIRGSKAAPVTLHGRSIGMMGVTRPVLETTFQNMISAMIFVISAAVSANTSKEFVKYRCAIGRFDIGQAIEKNGQLPLRNWWKKVKG